MMHIGNHEYMTESEYLLCNDTTQMPSVAYRHHISISTSLMLVYNFFSVQHFSLVSAVFVTVKVGQVIGPQSVVHLPP